jgi:1,4-alpha-glucan branching enzyme
VYGGSGLGNKGGVYAEAISSHSRPYSLSLTLPPLGALLLSRG